MALPAVLAVNVPAEDFGPGDWAAVARSAILAHENAVRDHRRRAGIQPVGFGEALRRPAEIVFAEWFLLPAKHVALLTIARAADPGGIGVRIGRGETEWRGFFSRCRMALGAGDIERQVRDDRRRAVVKTPLGADGR
jgi:hypothetical protein